MARLVIKMYLMVPLLKGLLGQTLPALRSVNRCCGFQCNIKVPTFDSEVKTSVFVLNEVKSDLEGQNEDTRTLIPGIAYLREALLLQVCDDALANQVRSLDDVQHLLVVILQ